MQNEFKFESEYAAAELPVIRELLCRTRPEDGIGMRDLAEASGLGERELREMILHLRTRHGMRIGSCPKHGYWLITDARSARPHLSHALGRYYTALLNVAVALGRDIDYSNRWAQEQIGKITEGQLIDSKQLVERLRNEELIF